MQVFFDADYEIRICARFLRTFSCNIKYAESVAENDIILL